MKTILKESLPNSTQGPEWRRQQRGFDPRVAESTERKRGEEERDVVLGEGKQLFWIGEEPCKGGNGNRSRVVPALHTFSLNRLDIPTVGVKLELKLT